MYQPSTPAARRAPTDIFFSQLLSRRDPLVYDALREETARQHRQLELIAPKNYTSLATRQAFASMISFTSGEGYPGRRYHAGMAHLDTIENLAIERARSLFNCAYANVQPHSGTQANQAVFFALLEPGDPVLSMALTAGGHLSHGLRANLSGRWFRVAHYGVRDDDGLIDYDEVRRLCREHRPKLVIVGGSSYPRVLDFQQFRAAADEVGAYLLADIAHFSGLVAAGAYPNPFPAAHIVTTTTNKNLRGPRGGLILCDDAAVARRLDAALFPGVQGGLLPEYVAAKAVALGEALLTDFGNYARRVLDNARALGALLSQHGYRVITGGTDTPLVMLDLRPHGLTGATSSLALEAAGLPCNRNLVPADPLPPSVTSGLRFGTSAVTTRGLDTSDMSSVAQWIAQILDALAEDPAEADPIAAVRDAVEEMADRYPLYSGTGLLYNTR